MANFLANFLMILMITTFIVMRCSCHAKCPEIIRTEKMNNCQRHMQDFIEQHNKMDEQNIAGSTKQLCIKYQSYRRCIELCYREIMEKYHDDGNRSILELMNGADELCSAMQVFTLTKYLPG